MNKLDKIERARIVHLLCEGMSIRAITRLTGVSKTTVTSWLWMRERPPLGIRTAFSKAFRASELQIDEIWGFVGAKVKNASEEAKAAGTAGDVWLWMATDADTKLVPCWYVGRATPMLRWNSSTIWRHASPCARR